MDIKCLIDTNIVIQLEEPDTSGLIKDAFAEFSAKAHKHGVKIFAHPDSLQDISRDKNEDRKRRTLSYVRKYPSLEKPPTATKDELEKFFGGITKSNDLIDCQLLYALKLNCVDYLITEDDGLHKRAKYAGLHDRVFSVKEFTNQLRRFFEPESVVYPHVHDEFVYSIDPNDPIFTSIRADYDKFDEWLETCRKEHRKAWVVRVKEEIAAICIRKDEVGENEYQGLGQRTLKMSTFKVGEQYRGSKIGELLLKTALNFCLENKYDSTYLTAFTKHEYLTEFLKDFGFEVHSRQTKRGEFVYYKLFGTVPKDLPRMEALDFHIRYYPHFYSDEEIKKYVVPIQPEYHNTLFPELSEQQELPLDTASTMVPGNTIKKVYLSHANLKSLEPGGLLLFYRSHDKKQLTTVGIVERSLRTLDLGEALRFVGKRSVYSVAQIKEMLAEETLLIEFRLIRHLKTPIGYRELRKQNVLTGPPQATMTLPNERFALIRNALV